MAVLRKYTVYFTLPSRWQILYNNGMMSDYSIYGEPIE